MGQIDSIRFLGHPLLAALCGFTSAKADNLEGYS